MKKTITIILLVSLLLPAGCSHTTEVPTDRLMMQLFQQMNLPRR